MTILPSSFVIGSDVRQRQRPFEFESRSMNQQGWTSRDGKEEI